MASAVSALAALMASSAGAKETSPENRSGQPTMQGADRPGVIRVSQKAQLQIREKAKAVTPAAKSNNATRKLKDRTGLRKTGDIRSDDWREAIWRDVAPFKDNQKSRINPAINVQKNFQQNKNLNKVVR